MGSQLVRIHRSIEVIPRVQPLIVLRCCGSKPLRKASWQPSPLSRLARKMILPLKWRPQSSQLLMWFDKNQGKNTNKDISTTGVQHKNE